MEPTQQQRTKFKTAQDWYNFLQSKNGSISGPELFELRKACYTEIEKHRGRPLLIYATKFLDGVPPGTPNFIDLSDLGPIDPQINGVPARSIKRGFEKAKERIAKEGPEALPAYIPLIEKYSLELLELCEDSEKLSKDLVSTWLKKYMFKGEKNVDKKIKKAVSYFSDYDTHLMHSRPLPMDKLTAFGLEIELADDTLQDLLWESYILLNGFFNVSPFVKLYESAHGVSWGKQFQQVFVGPQPQQKIKPQQ